MIIVKRLQFIFLFFLISLGYCYSQNKKLADPYRVLSDTLFIGIPNCPLSQVTVVKEVLSSLPDAKLIYTCEAEKRFMLLIKRKTYPDMSAIQAKVRTVNAGLSVYEKMGGWKSFLAVCEGEVVK